MTVLAEPPTAMSPPSGRPDGDHHDEVTLAAVPTAVTTVGLFVRLSLTRWSYGDAFTQRVTEAAEELVVHAVATTGVTDEAPFYADVFDDLRVIVVRLRTVGPRVVVEVWDQADVPPLPRLSQSPAIATCEHWDYALPSPGLRVVWCVVGPESPPKGDQSLPKRVPGPVCGTGSGEPAPDTDTALLLRVLGELRRWP